MKRLTSFDRFYLALVVATFPAAGVLIYAAACTPAQTALVRPAIKAGKLLCLTKGDAELCCTAEEAAQLIADHVAPLPPPSSAPPAPSASP